MSEAMKIDERKLIGLAENGVKLYGEMRALLHRKRGTIFIEDGVDPKGNRILRRVYPALTTDEESPFAKLWEFTGLPPSWENIEALTHLAVEPMPLKDFVSRISKISGGIYPIGAKSQLRRFLQAGLVTQDPRAMYVAEPPVIRLQQALTTR